MILQNVEIVDKFGNIVTNINAIPNNSNSAKIEDNNDNNCASTDIPAVGILDTMPLSRKRLRHPTNWKVNIRKAKCQSGKEYDNARGNIVKARSIYV